MPGRPRESFCMRAPQTIVLASALVEALMNLWRREEVFEVVVVVVED